MLPQPTHAVQDYLKAIHSLGGAKKRVSTNELAERLGVRAASVTGMIKRLSEAGWVGYVPSRGVKLTQQGIGEARRVIRRHRLMELFLTRVLGLDLSEVDAEAEALEHAISPRLEQAISAFLGEPMEDPHGHPIPTKEGKLVQRNLRPLNSFVKGDSVIIREVQDGDPVRLKRWSELGLLPGVAVKITDRQDLDGVFTLTVGKRDLVLGIEGISGLLGEKGKGN